MTDLSGMTALHATMILRAKCNELETWVKPRLGGPGTTDLDWLVADVALIAGITAEFIGRFAALEADRPEPSVPVDATGFLAEQRLRELEHRKGLE